MTFKMNECSHQHDESLFLAHLKEKSQALSQPTPNHEVSNGFGSLDITAF